MKKLFMILLLNLFLVPFVFASISDPIGFDLSNYPELFIENGNITTNFIMVVGENAPSSDTLALTEIATSIKEFLENLGVNPHDIDIGVRVDSEIINNYQDYNLIILSTSDYNLIADRFSKKDFEHGSLQLFHNGGSNNIALLVLGKKPEDTEIVARVLADYDEYQLKGTTVCISGSLSSPKLVTCPGGEYVSPEMSFDGCVEKCEFQLKKDCGSISRDSSDKCSVGQIRRACEEKCLGLGLVPSKKSCGSDCLLENICVPMGTRQNGMYCSINGEMLQQLEGGEYCDNNYECQSNSCLDSKCTDVGFWTKLIAWLSKIFDG
ncbi:hypothetical protein GF327_06080 [Candidatus Woesearchaeota archaeon]|nr:hypothetical protein [Candidatus Woesearchaeota archaeon]